MPRNPAIFAKQTGFILYISHPAGILAPSFKSTRIQHEIICKSLIPDPSGLILTLQDYWARRLHHCSTIGHGSRRGNFSSNDLPARAGARADGDCLCAAFSSSDRWPLRRKPEPLTALLSVPVVIKPSPDNIQELYLGSLKELGMDPTIHDIRFVEDNWENPTLGARGLGWEVWLNGMEVTQFTYFQQVGGPSASR